MNLTCNGSCSYGSCLEWKLSGMEVAWNGSCFELEAVIDGSCMRWNLPAMEVVHMEVVWNGSYPRWELSEIEVVVDVIILHTYISKKIGVDMVEESCAVK